MEPFNVEQVLLKLKEEFGKRDEIINKLYMEIQLLLKLHLNPKTYLIEIPDDLRRSADAVTDGQIVYLRKAETSELFQLNILTCKFIDKQVFCKYLRCSMVVINNTLVTIGGALSKEGPRSDELLCMDSNGQWVSMFPPMPTKRSRTTALTFNHLIIVIGGEDEKHTILKTVEILDTTSNQWFRVQDLPDSRSCTSGTIVDGYIYLLGGWRGAEPVSQVLGCSLENLFETTKLGSAAMPCVWETLPNLPVQEAACTCFCNTLVVVGGRANNDPVREIRTYDPMSNAWVVVGYLQKPRYICFAVGLPDRLIVLGGRKETTNTENTMEILA